MDKKLNKQASVILSRIHYHFGNPNGTLNIPENLPFMKEFLNEVKSLCLDIVVLDKSIKWWNNLTKHQQNDYEFKTYGAGYKYEDNTLCEIDIIKMYKLYN